MPATQGPECKRCDGTHTNESVLELVCRNFLFELQLADIIPPRLHWWQLHLQSGNAPVPLERPARSLPGPGIPVTTLFLGGFAATFPLRAGCPFHGNRRLCTTK